MKVAVTGQSGLIGTALSGHLRTQGHDVVPVVRQDPTPGEIGWSPAEGRIDADGLRDVDAVVHLAGAGIGDKRWNEDYKRTLVESRTVGTTLLAETLADLRRAGDGPSVLLSGSAVGFYGDKGDRVVTEADAPGDDFLSDLCVEWEAATAPASDAGLRVAHLRTGLVQTPEGGALAKTLLPFKLGLGGRLGSGQQWWSWISLDDEIRAIAFLLDAEVSGPVNLTGPEPVRNIEYTKALGAEIHRPTILPIPKFGPKLLLGREMAELLLFTSARVLPTALTDAGFEFRHRTIEACLAAVLGPQELA